MIVIENMGKETYFSTLEKMYPAAMKRFYQWIDEYKLAIGWSDMFIGEIVRTKREGNTEYTMGKSKIKFHDVPYEIQFGIIFRFLAEEVDGMNDEVYLEVSNDWKQNKIPERFRQLNDRFTAERDEEIDEQGKCWEDLFNQLRNSHGRSEEDILNKFKISRV